MASDNTRYVARIPIVPDDFEHQDSHIDHELVMDFKDDDIYIKKGDGYINITGKIKEDINQIEDGSSRINVVTDKTIPIIKERPENNWYFVVTETKTEDGESTPSLDYYIYCGLINSYDKNKNYVLIAQNIIANSGTMVFDIEEGYCPCVYVPAEDSAYFTDAETGKIIEYTIEDRIYAMNSKLGNYVMYDVYTLKVYEPGTHRININTSDAGSIIVTIDSNIPDISGLNLPNAISVVDGDCIGKISDPTWDEPRYIFKGYSTDDRAPVIIDPTKYKPDGHMTLYAWFEYNSSPAVLEYYTEFESI